MSLFCPVHHTTDQDLMPWPIILYSLVLHTMVKYLYLNIMYKCFPFLKYIIKCFAPYKISVQVSSLSRSERKCLKSCNSRCSSLIFFHPLHTVTVLHSIFYFYFTSIYPRIFRHRGTILCINKLYLD
jgi:hypothetical protein